MKQQAILDSKKYSLSMMSTGITQSQTLIANQIQPTDFVMKASRMFKNRLSWEGLMRRHQKILYAIRANQKQILFLALVHSWLMFIVLFPVSMNLDFSALFSNGTIHSISSSDSTHQVVHQIALQSKVYSDLIRRDTTQKNDIVYEMYQDMAALIEQQAVAQVLHAQPEYKKHDQLRHFLKEIKYYDRKVKQWQYYDATTSSGSGSKRKQHQLPNIVQDYFNQVSWLGNLKILLVPFLTSPRNILSCYLVEKLASQQTYLKNCFPNIDLVLGQRATRRYEWEAQGTRLTVVIDPNQTNTKFIQPYFEPRIFVLEFPPDIQDQWIGFDGTVFNRKAVKSQSKAERRQYESIKNIRLKNFFLEVSEQERDSGNSIRREIFCNNIDCLGNFSIITVEFQKNVRLRHFQVYGKVKMMKILTEEQHEKQQKQRIQIKSDLYNEQDFQYQYQDQTHRATMHIFPNSDFRDQNTVIEQGSIIKRGKDRGKNNKNRGFNLPRSY